MLCGSEIYEHVAFALGASGRCSEPQAPALRVLTSLCCWTFDWKLKSFLTVDRSLNFFCEVRDGHGVRPVHCLKESDWDHGVHFTGAPGEHWKRTPRARGKYREITYIWERNQNTDQWIQEYKCYNISEAYRFFAFRVMQWPFIYRGSRSTSLRLTHSHGHIVVW